MKSPLTILFLLLNIVISEKYQCPLLFLHPFRKERTEHTFGILSILLDEIDRINADPESLVEIPSVQIVDTKDSIPSTVNTVYKLLKFKEVNPEDVQTVNFNTTSTTSSDPCAIMGPFETSINRFLGPLISSQFKLPTIFPWPIHSQNHENNLLLSLAVGPEVWAYALFQYMNYIKVEQVCVFYSENDEGRGFWNEFQRLMASTTSKTFSQSFDATYFKKRDNQGSIYHALKVVRDSGFRNIIYLVSNEHLDELIASANDLGITKDDDYFHLFGNPQVFLDHRDIFTGENSPTQKFLGGSGVLSIDDARSSQQRVFLSNYNSLARNGDFISRVLNAFPKGTVDPDFVPNSNIYVDFGVPVGGGFVHDSLWSISKSMGKEENNVSSNSFGDTASVANAPTTDSGLYFESLTDLKFEGVTGDISFEENGVRKPQNFQFSILNLQLFYPDRNKIYFVKTAHRVWQKWVTRSQFVYADGTTNRPKLERVYYVENNYISSWIRITGLFMCFCTELLCISSFFVIVIKRNANNIMAAQPLFLLMVSMGSAVFTSSVIPFSFDESMGLTADHLTYACRATPWLAAIGYIFVYSALFSKLWRINKVLHLRTAHVFIRHVIAPFIFFLILVLAFLSTWSMRDPLSWKREDVRIDSYGLVVESYGSCTSENDSWFPYTICFVLFCVILTLATLVMAWKTRDVPDRYSESKYIFYAVFTQTQVWVISVPIFLLVQKDSVDVAFLCRAFSFSLFGASNILFIIGSRFNIIKNWASNLDSVSSLTFSEVGAGDRDSNISQSSGPVPRERTEYTSENGHSPTSSVQSRTNTLRRGGANEGGDDNNYVTKRKPVVKG